MRRSMPPLTTSPRRVLSAAVLAGLLAGLLAACAPGGDGGSAPAENSQAEATAASTSRATPTVPAPGVAAGHNLLLVTLDTTRADHLGAYGDPRAETPNLDRLAAGGLRFTDAVTPVPMTLPAHATLLTGLDPPGHGVRINGRFVLGAEHETLAEALQRAGYQTAAFVSSFVLDSRFGLDQGFDRYDARLETTRVAAFAPQTERSAGSVTDAAVAWLEDRAASGESGRPFFLWIHYFDPHDPYEPPEPFASRFADRPYAGEIAYTDRELGRLLSSLDASGLSGRTVIVATADHGESLGEHGERYHSRTLYEGAVRVPLILRVPGVTEGSGGAVDDRLVTLSDLAPTLLDLLGLDPLGETDGRSLLEGRDGGGPASPQEAGDRIVYLETLNTYLDNGWAPLYAARSHGAKYIRAPRPELYDLEEDPGERTDLLRGNGAGEAPGGIGLDRLGSFLDGRLAGQTGAGEVAAEALRADPEVRRRLEALGYLSGGGPAAPEEPGELPDPKDMLPLLEELTEGRRLLAEGRPAEAERRARRILARSSRDRAALQLLGEAYATQGRLEDAERVLRRHLEVGPSVGASVLLAQVMMQQGRLEEAEALLDQAVDLEPGHGAVPLARGDLWLVRGRPREAVASYRRAAEVDPYRFRGLAEARIERVRRLVEGGSP